MNRRIFILAVLPSIGACGLSVPRSANAPVPVGTSRAADSPWTQVVLAGSGLSARFPTSVKESAGVTGDEPRTPFRAFTASANGLTFGVLEYVVEKRPADDQYLANSTKLLIGGVERSRVALGTFRGAEVSGMTKDGKRELLRVFLVGASLLAAYVSADSGGVDESAAARFFDSLRLDVPWQVTPIPELGLSVALPQKVLSIPAEKDGIRSYYLGGLKELGYFVSVTPIAEGNQGAPDALLDRTIQAFANSGKVVWSSPIELDGVPGRDVLLDTGRTRTRARIYVRDDRFYQTLVSSSDPDALNSEEAKRFLNSLRWFE